MSTMTKKEIGSFAVVGVLMLAGCQSGMYSSNVSVNKNDAGVSDYTIVNSLDVEEFSQSMPVVVETKSTNQKGEHDLSLFLWFFTLGIVPAVESEATTYDVTVKTPIGEKSGTCTIEASSWMGWLPIFIPYPGIAEERAMFPKLPNANLERKTRDQLVANLVSQFPKTKYAEFKVQRSKGKAIRERFEKERAEAERVRLAKDPAKRAEDACLAMRTELYEKTVEQDLASIKASYAKERRYENPFLGDHRSDGKRWRKNQDEKSDWLSKWASSRLDLTEEAALAGEALLSEFGAKYLPNAYANYEKKREALVELQQVFNEEFSRPWTIKSTDPKWNSFNKVLEKFVKARTECFICHDELCHYWLLSRFGVLTDKDFAQIDTQRLAVHLLPENVEWADYTLLEVNAMDGKVSDFAVKYAPESNAIYQKMEREFKELDALLLEVFIQLAKMDNVRYSRALTAAVAKRNDLVREMNTLSLQLQTWHMDHRTTEKSSEDVAKCDAAMSKQLKPFMDALPNYIKEHALGPIIATSDMIAIPGQRYRMQRTEVTQLQWMAVMGDNPSKFHGPDHPVENVSCYDCHKFIKRASQMDGRQYRLPKEEEWQFACLAGSISWGAKANGECGPLETMGWYADNTRVHGGPHAVALKEPNAWGLFDMHGNVSEWCEDPAEAGSSVTHGGSWRGDAWQCSAFCPTRRSRAESDGTIGFRLVAPLN